jgi:hypothetical protein
MLCVLLLTSPNVALVQDIIMHQAGCVDHLGDLCQAPVLLGDLSAAAKAVE